MKLRTQSLTLALILAVTCTAGAFAQDKSQKLYKWVDKDGVVHYGSTVPPEYANQQLQILNSEGVTVQTVAAPKTPEELAKDKQAKAEAAAKAKQEKAQQENDQMLLDTYTSVADIERDRKSRLAAIDSQIKFINNSVSGLQNTLNNYQSQADRLTKAHKPIPASLKKNMDDTQAQLDINQKLLLQQEQNKQEVQDRYNAYIKRYQQLTGQSAASSGN
jgi:chromosome segregation ATPase